MNEKRFQLRNFWLKNKTVFLRVDFNVPIKNKKVQNNNKIKAAIPTIKYLLAQHCKIIIATHLGQPNGKIISELKTAILLPEIKKLIHNTKINSLNDCIGEDIKEKIERGKGKQIFLLENLRFHREEEADDHQFAQQLAELADVYINDAFAVCHRKNASVSAITKYIPAVCGFLLEKEIKQLQKALTPKRPAVWILGGAKLDKIKLIMQALQKADYLLIGGALAFSFLRAKKIPVGVSKVDVHSIKIAHKIMSKNKWARKIILPLDFKVTETFKENASAKIVAYNEIKSHQIALDIGPKTIKLFEKYLSSAKTIVWNGPLGYFEWKQFSDGTKEMGNYLSKLDALKIAGGGETVEAINKFKQEHHFTHVSTGGGAALAFLSGENLPGIAALESNYKVFKKKLKN